MPGEQGESDQPRTAPQAERKGLFSFLRKRPKTETEPTQLPKSESAASILARTALPEREVSLEDISLYDLPLNWEAAKDLTLSINRLKGTPIQKFELQDLKPPESLNDAIPVVASAIANHYNPEIPLILPNEEEIMAMKPWLNKVSQFIGRFSAKLQYRFGRYIEGTAENMVKQSAKSILDRVDMITPLGDIRSRFTPELAGIYKRVLQRRYREVEDFFGFESHDEEVPVEENIEELLTKMKDVPYGGGDWINKDDFPLTWRLLKLSAPALRSLDPWVYSIAGSEMTQGIRTYLVNEGEKALPEAASPVRGFDLFDADTWGALNLGRAYGETFKQEQLEAVKRNLPDVLAKVKDVLPEDGTKVADSLKTLAENILILSKSGVSNSQIASALFSKKSLP